MKIQLPSARKRVKSFFCATAKEGFGKGVVRTPITVRLAQGSAAYPCKVDLQKGQNSGPHSKVFLQPYFF